MSCTKAVGLWVYLGKFAWSIFFQNSCQRLSFIVKFLLLETRQHMLLFIVPILPLSFPLHSHACQHGESNALTC